LIYERDLDESIARYQGEVNPSIETCRKLAACLIVKRELFGEPERLPTVSNLEQVGQYSYAAEPVPVDTYISYTSDTEFSRVIDGRKPEDVWPIIDELISTVQVLMPRLYDGVMRKLQ